MVRQAPLLDFPNLALLSQLGRQEVLARPSIGNIICTDAAGSLLKHRLPFGLNSDYTSRSLFDALGRIIREQAILDLGRNSTRRLVDDATLQAHSLDLARNVT